MADMQIKYKNKHIQIIFLKKEGERFYFQLNIDHNDIVLFYWEPDIISLKQNLSLNHFFYDDEFYSKFLEKVKSFVSNQQ